MNENQKEFTVQQITKYNAEKNQAKSAATKNAVLAGMFSLYTIFCVMNLSFTEDASTLQATIEGLFATATASITGIPTLICIKNMLIKILRVAGLENMIADLEHQLEMAGFSEDKTEGKKR